MFRRKHGLDFLSPDEGKEVLEGLRVWVEKSMYGGGLVESMRPS